MNKLTRTIILATAALATVATSFEFASARDRDGYWRHHQRHHHRHHFRDRAFVAGALGVTAGVIIGEALAQPRVVYRPRPVVIEREPVYVEPETVYADPDYDYDRPRVQYEGPVDDDRDYRDANGYEDDQSVGDNDFPAPPRRHHADRNSDRRDHRTVSAGDVEPWTAEWRAWCSQRYQSFNPQNGTFKGYDGRAHFCTVGG